MNIDDYFRVHEVYNKLSLKYDSLPEFLDLLFDKRSFVSGQKLARFIWKELELGMKQEDLENTIRRLVSTSESSLTVEDFIGKTDIIRWFETMIIDTSFTLTLEQYIQIIFY